MPTTLLVEESDQLQSFYSINLLTWIGSSVDSYSDVNLAIKSLEDHFERYDLIICRDKVHSKINSDKIIAFLLNHNKNLPVIIFGQTDHSGEAIFHLDSCLDIRSMVQTAAKSLNITAKQMAALEVPDFFAIPIQFFHHLNYTICDLFWDAELNESYEIKFPGQKTFNNDEIKNLTASGHTTLYVKKEDRLKFVTFLTQELISVLELKEFNQKEQITAMEMSHDLLSQKLNSLGITEDTVKLANKNLKDMIQTSKKTPALMRLIKRLLESKAGFRFKHNQVLMFVASHLMDHIEWGTPEQKEKLQFIAFFHDIALENDEQAMIHSEEQLKASGLSDKKKELVRSHAQIASKLVSQYPRAPMGSEQIIRQHHGISHGIGFAKSFTTNLSPMTIVFVLAEDFATDAILEGKEFNIQRKISQMRETYTTKRFEKIIDILESLTVR